MRRALGIALVALSIIGLSACSSSNPWADKARAYAETLDDVDVARVAEYIATACANPNLSPLELSEKVGAWDEISGGTFSDFGDAVRVVCPEQF